MSELRRRSGLFVFFHWVCALLMVIVLLSGEIFSLSKGAFPAAMHSIMVLHVAVGMAGFTLITPRVLARHGGTKFTSSAKIDIVRCLAYGMHVILYIFMIAQPLVGWAIVNAKGMTIPMPLLGFDFPRLVKKDANLVLRLVHAHMVLTHVFYGLLAMHVGAAFWHHFVKRDSTLRNMMPAIGERDVQGPNTTSLDSCFKCNTCIAIGCCDEEKLQPPERSLSELLCVRHKLMVKEPLYATQTQGRSND